jgi:nicotinic acid mononucleotide adenylyltransferase
VVGLVSGSFDPMTLAHVALAGALRAEGAAPVLLVYASRTMPKDSGVEPPLLTPERRLASLVAWCGHRTGFLAAVCSHGLYADQVEATADAFPGADLVVGLGSDKVLQLLDPAWYEDREAALDRLFRRARVAYALRAGQEGDVDRALAANLRWAERVRPLDLPPELGTVSSAEVRRRVRRREDVRSLVPPEVLPLLSEAPSGGGQPV